MKSRDNSEFDRHHRDREESQQPDAVVVEKVEFRRANSRLHQMQSLVSRDDVEAGSLESDLPEVDQPDADHPEVDQTDFDQTADEYESADYSSELMHELSEHVSQEQEDSPEADTASAHGRLYEDQTSSHYVYDVDETDSVDEGDWGDLGANEVDHLYDHSSLSPEPITAHHSGDEAEIEVIVEEAPPVDWSLMRWMAAVVASLVLHFWFASTLSSVMIEDREYEAVIPIETQMLEDNPEVEQEEKIVEYELANPDEMEKEQQTALNARSVGLIQSEKPVQEAAPQLEIASVEFQEAAPVYDIPEGTEVDESIVIQGTSGEGIIQLDAALDRITWEIAANVKEKKVLIVWVLDASGSMSEQRKDVARRMKRIYGELGALETAGQIPNQDKPILSGVVAFGEKATFMTPTPTANIEELLAGIDKIPIDESGIENIFGTLRQILDKWQVYRQQQGRRILLMTVTDEAGDDFSQHLNSTINIINRLGSKAYVVGPPAVFGKRQGFVPYLAPEDGKTYQIPVDIGPESAMAENVQMSFWFNGPQYENLSSGLGPYALARLVHETGGAYFMTNMTTASGLSPVGTYANQTMKSFSPDYRFGSIEEYLRDIDRKPIRKAVYMAGQLSLKYKTLGTPELELRVNPNNYLQTIAQAQQSVAVSTAMIDNILAVFSPNLEVEYRKESSPRWRMAYNLSYGRLLAQRLRCLEYNSALAQLKLLGTQDIQTRVNRFVFRPDATLNFAAGMKKPKDLSETLLKRCINEAPGTPWAIMAARELQHPYGIKVIEQFDPPPPPPSAMENNPAQPGKKKGVLILVDDKKKPKPKPAAPPPPPKLPRF